MGAGRGAVVSRRLVRIEEGRRRTAFDSVAAEEPLEIRVGGRPLAVTMRTPGHDFELAAGFLLTEGVVGEGSRIRSIRYCVGQGEVQEHNVVDADVAGPLEVPPRAVYTTSSCGLCGRSTIDAVAARVPASLADDPLRLDVDLLAALPERLRDAQRVFARTGGLHAAGLFDADGGLVCVREDVGRHNAFDKVLGWATLGGRLPLRSHLLLASGRASFELVQKAVLAGAPVLAAVSAPSSLAVELAEEAGMTLIGFLRGRTMNVYAGADRVVVGTNGGQ
jgi:FdhD protein